MKIELTDIDLRAISTGLGLLIDGLEDRTDNELGIIDLGKIRSLQKLFDGLEEAYRM